MCHKIILVIKLDGELNTESNTDEEPVYSDEYYECLVEVFLFT
jgi:hypothetical protein